MIKETVTEGEMEVPWFSLQQSLKKLRVTGEIPSGDAE